MAVQQKTKNNVSKKAAPKRATTKKTPAAKTAGKRAAPAQQKKTTAPAVASPKKAASVVKSANVASKSAARAPAARAAAANADLSAVLAKKRKEEFSAEELEIFRTDLLAMHERLTTQIGKMRENALTRDDEVNHEEDGSDAFDRLFTLERAGNEQKTLNKITNALRALKEGTYGVCEACDGLIEYARLHALPFVKNCIACQSDLERKRSGSVAAPHRKIP